eukprot:4961415-Pleurochrysis_carterae.AAC.1
MDHAGHRCLENRDICELRYLPTVRARRGISKVHYVAREPWTIAFATEFVEPTLPALYSRKHGRR